MIQKQEFNNFDTAHVNHTQIHTYIQTDTDRQTDIQTMLLDVTLEEREGGVVPALIPLGLHGP